MEESFDSLRKVRLIFPLSQLVTLTSFHALFSHYTRNSRPSAKFHSHFISYPLREYHQKLRITNYSYVRLISVSIFGHLFNA